MNSGTARASLEQKPKLYACFQWAESVAGLQQ